MLIIHNIIIIYMKYNNRGVPCGGGSRGDGVLRWMNRRGGEGGCGARKKQFERIGVLMSYSIIYNFMNRDDDGRVAGKAGKNIRP